MAAGDRRVDALDGLRAVAVLIVMGHHAVAYYNPQLTHVFSGGFLGVDVFFVLSGFLITSLLLREARARGRIDLRSFYVRRALRLFPALAVMVAAMTVYTLITGYPSIGYVLRTLGFIALYVSNWAVTFRDDVIPGLGHTWSLAVEEQFYVVWPLVVILGVRARWTRRGWCAVLGVLIGASAVVKAVLWARADGDWSEVYYRTDARADALLIGALLAVLHHYGTSLRPARPLFVPAAVVLLVAAVSGVHPDTSALYYGGLTVVAVASAVLVSCLLEDSAAQIPWAVRALSTPVLSHMGRISYALYLWHVPVFLVTALYLRAATPTKLMFAVLVTFAVAELSMIAVERPFLQLKRRFEPDRRRYAPRHRVAPARRVDRTSSTFRAPATGDPLHGPPNGPREDATRLPG